MRDIQGGVQDVVDELIGNGAERGLQVAAYVDGRLVVDAVAGVADQATSRPVEPGTVFYSFSVGKGVMATLVHRQVEAGLLGYDTRVAELWPGFAAHGKGAVTVRQVLDHSAGLPGIPVAATIDDVASWETMVAALEQAEPWWEPGTEVGYHAYTFGYLAGEIVRRATGLPLADALRNDLAGPIGHPDEIWFGMPEPWSHRLAVLEDGPSDPDWARGLPADLPMFRAGPMSLLPTAALGNDPRMLAADVPAVAKLSARAVARMYAAVIGEVDGVRLLSAQLAAQVSEVSAEGVDQVFGNPSRWGLGYALGLPWEGGESVRMFGMAGSGGSWAGADLDRGLALAVTKNRLTDDFTTVRRVVETVLDSV